MFHSRLNLRHIKWSTWHRQREKQRYSRVLPQQYAMYKTSVRGAGTNESRREGDDCLYHTPESGCGDKHTVIRREASGSLTHSRSILSAIFRQIFSPSCSSVFLASSPSVTVLSLNTSNASSGMKNRRLSPSISIVQAGTGTITGVLPGTSVSFADKWTESFGV